MNRSDLARRLPLVDPEFTLLKFQAIGAALLQVQELEGGVAVYLVVVYHLGKREAQEFAESLLSRTKKQTLGQLVRTLKKEHAAAPDAPQNLVDGIEAFVLERNWLVHRSRETTRYLLYRPDRRQELLARIDAVGDKATSLLRGFQEALVAHLAGKGMSLDQIYGQIDQVVQGWLVEPPPG